MCPKRDILKSTVHCIAKDHSHHKIFTKIQRPFRRRNIRISFLNFVSIQRGLFNILLNSMSSNFSLLASQQYHAETLCICLDICWKGLRELSPGYLKRTIATRLANQLILHLLHPVHHTINATKDNMLDVTCAYYSELYSPAPIH